MERGTVYIFKKHRLVGEGILHVIWPWKSFNGCVSFPLVVRFWPFWWKDAGSIAWVCSAGRGIGHDTSSHARQWSGAARQPRYRGTHTHTHMHIVRQTGKRADKNVTRLPLLPSFLVVKTLKKYLNNTNTLSPSTDKQVNWQGEKDFSLMNQLILYFSEFTFSGQSLKEVLKKILWPIKRTFRQPLLPSFMYINYLRSLFIQEYTL